MGALSYVISGLPTGTGLSIDPVTGVISGTPTAADTAASPIITTVKVTDPVGLSQQGFLTLETTQTANPSPPDFIVKADGTGDFTTIGAAIASLTTPGEIIEIQPNTPGVPQTFVEAIDLTGIAGTDGSEYIIRGESGEAIIVYRTNARVITLSNTSYVHITNLQLGRDQTLNGWSYLDAGASVEHDRCIHAVNGSDHIKFTDVTEYGGSFYDSSLVDSSCSEFWFLRHTWKYAGANANKPGDPGNDRSNGVTFQGNNSVFEVCKGSFCGHNIVANQGNYNAFINCDWDADWTAENGGNGFDGMRTHANAIEKGATPFGPYLMDGCLIRNSQATVDAPNVPATKMHGFRGIGRRNMVYDGVGEAFHISPLVDSTNVAQGICLYNNTVYLQDSLCDWNDRTNTTIGLGGALIKNNLAQLLAQANDQAVKKIVDTIGAGANPDGWNLDIYDKNIFRDAAGGDVNVRFKDDTTNQTKTLAATETDFPNVFTNNTDAAITFPNIANRTSTTLATAKNAFEPTTAAALASAEPMALATDAGTGTNPTLDNANWIYNATDWGHDWMSRPDDYIKHVPAGLDPTSNGTIVQVTAVNYTTGQLTIDTSITWAIGDEFYPVEADGTTLTDNVGAWQATV